MIATGLDRLLAEPAALAGRRFGLLAHGAAVTAELVPGHLALSQRGLPPAALFGPEHGYYGVEQDMVPAASSRDPWTGAEIVSLYGAEEASLRPRAEAFAGLDLLLIDLQDVGSRYYTYAATAIWAAEVALAAGCEVWVLDRPNPLGGVVIEGNLPRPGLESFVGAFRLPVRHGLTLGEIFRLEVARRHLAGPWRVIPVSGWRRGELWSATGRPWLNPSPNMPSFATALVYPGLCLVEATELSEGRGTTRPFEWIGSPGVEPLTLVEELAGRELPGVRFVPTCFRPQFQKHASRACAGVQVVVTDAARFAPYRTGLELLAAWQRAGGGFAWRSAPYEFVDDRPAIDLLTGDPSYRRQIEAGGSFAEAAAGWEAELRPYREERAAALLYPEEAG